MVLDVEPGYPPAVLGKGQAQAQLGDKAGAEATLATLPLDPQAVQALADLLLVDRPLEAAELYRRLQNLELGEVEPFRMEARALLAAGDLDGAQNALDRYMDLAREPSPEAGDLMLDLSTALHVAGRREEARRWVEAWMARWPEGERLEEAKARLDRLDVESEAAQLYAGAAQALTEAQRRQLQAADADLRAGRLGRARERLEELLKEAPRAPEAWGLYGRVLLAQEDIAGADRALQAATALAPEEAAWHRELGRLLAARYGPNQRAEAEEHLRKAAALRPDWVELYLEIAELQAARGEPLLAVQSLDAYLRRPSDPALAEKATKKREDLLRARPPAPSFTAERDVPPGVDARAWEALNVARVYFDRGQDAEALAEVNAALKLQDNLAPALHLKARILGKLGRDEEAQRALEAALTVEPDQPQVILELGYALEAAGANSAAEARYREAAQKGSEEALVALALLVAAQEQSGEARDLLDTFFLTATTSSRRYEEARALKRQLDEQYRRKLAIGGAVVGLLAAVPIAFALQRQRARPLRALVEAVPEAWPDVASLVGAIRHEVLKHNTTVLGSVADALERGDPATARAALERLLVGPDAVVERWEAYIRELEALGRKHGVTLDLRRKDPVFGPMNQAFLQLRRIGHTPKVGDAPALRALGEALNLRGYAELGRLVREGAVQVVDAALLQEIWDTLRREPAFDGHPLPELDLEVPEPLPARIFRRPLEDVVANLLRNAVQAGATSVRVRVLEESDPITGLEWVVLRFGDDAPGELQNSDLRNRPVDRGLGLVADRVARHEGALSVEPEPGLAKALVVRLPRAEEPEVS